MVTDTFKKNSFQRFMQKGWKLKRLKISALGSAVLLVTVQSDGQQGRGIQFGLDLIHGLGWQKQ